MNNDQFKFGIKLTITICILVFIIIIGLFIYIFHSNKATPDIYSEILSNTSKDANLIDISEISLESKGINKEEFENYLSLFGRQVREYYTLEDKEEKNTLMLDSAVSFLTTLYMNEHVEDGILTYEADKINKIVTEMNGIYINKKLDVTEIYKYDEEKNVYIPQQLESPGYLYIETVDINKIEDRIEAEFKVAFPEETDALKYNNNEQVKIETYTVKAVILENEEYEYSKYYVSSLEILSKEKIEYNK